MAVIMTSAVDTPQTVVVRLNQALNTVLQNPELKNLLIRSGAEVREMRPAEFAGFIREETTKYDMIIKEEFCSKLLYGGCSGFEAAVNALP